MSKLSVAEYSVEYEDAAELGRTLRELDPESSVVVKGSILQIRCEATTLKLFLELLKEWDTPRSSPPSKFVELSEGDPFRISELIEEQLGGNGRLSCFPIEVDEIGIIQFFGDWKLVEEAAALAVLLDVRGPA